MLWLPTDKCDRRGHFLASDMISPELVAIHATGALSRWRVTNSRQPKNALELSSIPIRDSRN